MRDTAHVGAEIGLPGFYGEGHGEWSPLIEFTTGVPGEASSNPPGFLKRLKSLFR